MTKTALITAVETAKTNIHDALQTVYDALNNGQKKQLIKNADVKMLLTFSRQRDKKPEEWEAYNSYCEQCK